MTIACPCCKASNAAATCRRCRADLTLLFRIEERRNYHVNVAKRFAADSRWAEALRQIDSAEQLRAGEDVNGLRAALFLHQGHFGEALVLLSTGDCQ